MIVLKRKICIVTGTRAEYGLLYWLMKGLRKDEDFELQIVVTGMHLSPEFGLTYKQIERDGFIINEKVEMLLSTDSETGVVKSIGLGTIGLSEAFQRLKPDLIVILGDRYEMLAASQAALIMRIPIAHLHGGELTYGAYDDAIRHSITKMANFHFVSSECHRNRVVQLGESPERVWNVGALGIENILRIPLLSREELYQDLQLNTSLPILLVTCHPETNGDSEGVYPLLAALTHYKDYNILFTGSNADNGGREINEAIKQFVGQYENALYFDSLGQLRYLSAVKYADAVIGNSSSGLIEVPYLLTPTVNCGDRQSGRDCPSSVFHAPLTEISIMESIDKALVFKGPYEKIFGDGKVSNKIIDLLKGISSYSIQKEFFDL